MAMMMMRNGLRALARRQQQMVQLSAAQPSQQKRNIGDASDQPNGPNHKLRRSLLYLPGNDDRKAIKARDLNVDCVCLDLEDAVALNQKEAARENVVKLLSEVDFGDSDIAVRINPPMTELAFHDLEAIFNGPVQPKTLVVPKVESADHMQWLYEEVYTTVDNNREDGGVNSEIQILCQIETALGLLNMRSICEFNEGEETLNIDLVGLIFGSDDYVADIGATRTAAGTELLYARQAVVTHAKAFGLQAIDLVNINFQDMDELKEESEAGARMGFTGKQIIHPNQLDIVQEAFSPSQQRIDWALALVEAFEAQQEEGKGAFTYNNQMIDMPTLLQCRNTLAAARKSGKLAENFWGVFP